MRKVRSAIKLPLISNMVPGGKTPLLPGKVLSELGYCASFYPISALYAATSAMTKVYKEIIQNEKVSKISIVGAGMVSTPGVTFKMFKALSDEKINILAISTSEIKISVIIEEDNALQAIKKLHTTFDLD